MSEAKCLRHGSSLLALVVVKDSRSSAAKVIHGPCFVPSYDPFAEQKAFPPSQERLMPDSPAGTGTTMLREDAVQPSLMQLMGTCVRTLQMQPSANASRAGWNFHPLRFGTLAITKGQSRGPFISA